MTISSWGNYPKINNTAITFSTAVELKKHIANIDEFSIFGNGRSYGDSALNANIIHTKKYNHFLSFDDDTGLLYCQSGVLLSDIIDVFTPKGWFLPVTPGTKYITVGGAIASDVHGKNHHVDGCFSEFVQEFSLMFADGSIKICKRNDELFLATCGGMGLTGVILDVKFKLKKINSTFIKQKTIKTNNLKDTFNAFEEVKDSTYSVAWIDCLATHKSLGRSIITAGDFAYDNNIYIKKNKKITIPFYFPQFILNNITVKIFNWLYYKKAKNSINNIYFDDFFYPLDKINNWNKIYGKNGFLQYQIIVPKNEAYIALHKLLTKIAESGKGSFLAVLKLYGKENNNYLSFPLEGYSLALDFKIDNKIFKLLDELDAIVEKYNGRVYLTKDGRVQRDKFVKGYKNYHKFISLRKEYNINNKLNSLQSKRLEL
jgi:FAD/FMN-containing dehydrogenase